MSDGESVYQRALGARFADLDPRLHAYFGPVPPGSAGVGRGVYDVAGSRRRILRPVFAGLARRCILFPEFGRDIPFMVVNAPTGDGALSARRSFDFPGRARVLRDRIAVADGRLVDRIGRGGGLEATLRAAVVDGGMRLTSTRLAVRLGRLRVPLPRLARVTVDERATPVGQHVDVRLRVPLLGEVFRYAGSFTFTHTPLSEIEGIR